MLSIALPKDPISAFSLTAFAYPVGSSFALLIRWVVLIRSLACAAALAVINSLESSDLIAGASVKGDYFCQKLSTQLADNAAIVDIRHLGLMIGIELIKPCAELVAKALQHGVLINVTAENTIRLLPPLVISEPEIDHLCDVLVTLIEEFTR